MSVFVQEALPVPRRHARLCIFNLLLPEVLFILYLYIYMYVHIYTFSCYFPVPRRHILTPLHSVFCSLRSSKFLLYMHACMFAYIFTYMSILYTCTCTYTIYMYIYFYFFSVIFLCLVGMLASAFPFFCSRTSSKVCVNFLFVIRTHIIFY